jgi:hypothetical protein
MQVSAHERVGERAAVPLVCVVAAASIFLSSWLLLLGRREPAGWVCLAAGIALVTGGALLKPSDRLGRVVLSFADRLFDGGVLGAIVWVTRIEQPEVAAGALVALAAGFLASYIRARGGSLGYGIEEGIVTPGLRYGLISAGLIAGWAWTVWAVAVLMLLASAVRASQVAKEERQ